MWLLTRGLRNLAVKTYLTPRVSQADVAEIQRPFYLPVAETAQPVIPDAEIRSRCVN